MYILHNNNKVPMSLLNLSLSSLYQNKLNSALTKYVVPKTLSQQAPPCYLFHFQFICQKGMTITVVSIIFLRIFLTGNTLVK